MTMCKRNAKADWSQTKNKNKKMVLIIPYENRVHFRVFLIANGSCTLKYHVSIPFLLKALLGIAC